MTASTLSRPSFAVDQPYRVISNSEALAGPPETIYLRFGWGLNRDWKYNEATVMMARNVWARVNGENDVWICQETVKTYAGRVQKMKTEWRRFEDYVDIPPPRWPGGATMEWPTEWVTDGGIRCCSDGVHNACLNKDKVVNLWRDFKNGRNAGGREKVDESEEDGFMVEGLISGS